MSCSFWILRRPWMNFQIDGWSICSTDCSRRCAASVWLFVVHSEHRSTCLRHIRKCHMCFLERHNFVVHGNQHSLADFAISEPRSGTEVNGSADAYSAAKRREAKRHDISFRFRCITLRIASVFGI